MSKLLRVFILFLLPMLAVAPAGAAQTDGQSHYAPFDDFLVHYKSWGSGDRVVILIHGFTLDQSWWKAQISALAKGHRVIALDLPGHGDSGRPADVTYSPDLYARAVEAVAKDAKLRHASLIGHSLGLPIIHTVLKRKQITVDQVVFIEGAVVAAPDGSIAPQTAKRLNDLAAAMTGPDLAGPMDKFAAPLLTQAPAELKGRILAQMKTVDAHVAQSTFAHLGDADVWKPAKFTLPVLALYAKPVKPGVKDWLEASYPKAKLVQMDKVDHFPQLEQPDAVNKAILAFLH